MLLPTISYYYVITHNQFLLYYPQPFISMLLHTVITYCTVKIVNTMLLHTVITYCTVKYCIVIIYVITVYLCEGVNYIFVDVVTRVKLELEDQSGRW